MSEILSIIFIVFVVIGLLYNPKELVGCVVTALFIGIGYLFNLDALYYGILVGLTILILIGIAVYDSIKDRKNKAINNLSLEGAVLHCTDKEITYCKDGKTIKIK